MAENIAKFRFITHQILKTNIEIKDPSNISKELEVEVKKSSGVNEEELKYKLDLEIKINDVNNSLLVEIMCDGFFEFDQDISDREKHIFFNTSAPAILFPYLRAYITSLTSLSGIQPIVLPTINLSGRAKDKDSENN